MNNSNMADSSSSYTGTNGNVSKAILTRKYLKISNKSADNKKRIVAMVVDDDFDICNLTRMALQKQGLDVYGFTDPLLALEHFRANCDSCNIVISDLRMPAMNGIEFLQNIKKVKPTTKVLIMSAFTIEGDPEYAGLFKQTKINGFIQKPMSMRQLTQTIISHIKQK
jgi:two-component system cell cycle response regulator CpdR